MNVKLTPFQARVLGSMIEKQITTPENYPLSLNALTNACNQKSNREPVLELSEATVKNTLDELKNKLLVRGVTGTGSRVTKYEHRFCNTEFGDLELTEQELGILCVLFLRGPQTPGELRTRTGRLCTFNGVEEVDSTLQQLIQREDGPFVARLEREPGKRECRYAQLLSETPEPVVVSGPSPTPSSEVPGASGQATSPPSAQGSEDRDRISALERDVKALRGEIEQIKRKLHGEF